MRLKKNDVYNAYVKLVIDGVAESWTGKTGYVIVDSGAPITLTPDPDQTTNKGLAYAPLTALNATGSTSQGKKLTWYYTVTATGETITIEFVEDHLKFLEVWE